MRYPLRKVLFLVVAATVADCEDYDEIALSGRNHLAFLRRFSEFHFGTPCADWLRVVMNHLDPALFQACFCDWAQSLRPDAAKLIAIDGKTSRRSHDRKSGRRALHMVSAFATGARLVLAQEAVDEKENECAVRATRGDGEQAETKKQDTPINPKLFERARLSGTCSPSGYSSRRAAVSLNIRRRIHGRNRPVDWNQSYP